MRVFPALAGIGPGRVTPHPPPPHHLAPPSPSNHNSSDTIKLIKIINESRMFQTYLKDVLFWEVSAEIVRI